MIIQIWQIEKVSPYANNPRDIPQSAINKVADSIDRYGWQQPIVVDQQGVIVAGHVRWLAAKQLALKQVPVHVAELAPELARAYRLADNRSHEETKWDDKSLRFELEALKAIDFDLKLTGFDNWQIDDLLANNTEPEATRSGQALPEPVIGVGDVLQCGPHRVVCGDSTNADHVARAFNGAKPLLMLTDPPYAVDYKPEWREKAGLGKIRQIGTILNDNRADWRAAYSLFPGDVTYVWHAGLHAAEVAAGLESAGFELRAQIIWSKQHFVLSGGLYHWQHEPCWFAVRKGQKAHWRGDRKQSTVWSVPNLNPFGKPNTEETLTGHATQKPIELMRRPIENHTDRGDLVYDPFMGSGTCLIAAEQGGRVCCGLELDPKYVELLVGRWEQLTGRSATLEGDGRTLSEIRAKRLAA